MTTRLSNEDNAVAERITRKEQPSTYQLLVILSNDLERIPANAMGKEFALAVKNLQTAITRIKPFF